MRSTSVVPSEEVWKTLTWKLRPFDDFQKYGLHHPQDWTVWKPSHGLREAWILEILHDIDSGNFKPAGDISDWDKGWQEILREFDETGSLDSLRPHYLRRSGIMRLNKEFVMPFNPEFEMNWYRLLLAYLFNTFLKPHKNIYEFGCGTGHNLAQFREWDSTKCYYGLDWSSSAVNLVDDLGKRMHGSKFDLCYPAWEYVLQPSSAVLTIGALEQTGQQYGDFIQYLLKNKPAIVVHIEPIIEWYNWANLVDYTAIRYHKARGYWVGFPDYMLRLHNDDKIKIVEARRFGVGSKYLEGYMLWTWRPA